VESGGGQATKKKEEKKALCIQGAKCETTEIVAKQKELPTMKTKLNSFKSCNRRPQRQKRHESQWKKGVAKATMVGGGNQMST